MHAINVASFLLLIAPLTAVAAPYNPKPPCTTTTPTPPCTTSSTLIPQPYQPEPYKPEPEPYQPIVTPAPVYDDKYNGGKKYDPSTVTVTYVPPSPPSPPPPPPMRDVKRCVQQWYGTAPFCNGKCPGGWTNIRSGKKADTCEANTVSKIIDQCNEISGNSCWFGTKKQLCEKCTVERVPA